jgi:D-alanine--poly(phosphoribitol) ligase subunit 1
MNYNLAQPFYESAHRYPDAVAIHADGRGLLYRDVLQQVKTIAAWMRSLGAAPRRVGILASRSSGACIGILASAWIGAAYVPVNLAFPEAGILDIVRRSGLDALIADKEGSQLLTPKVMAACPSKVLAWRNSVPGPSRELITDYTELNPAPSETKPNHVDPTAPGYILYTSGSTGVPKGVVVSVSAVAHLLGVLDSKYALRSTDRVAEPTATTFDLSVYDMFATWRVGASLYIIPSKQMAVPVNFIKEHQLTVWLSVPSVATLMARMKLLKRGAFPSLRQTFFCGEPLLGSTAAQWQKAAPSSTVTNMYGPTEATVMCTGEDFGPDCAMTRDIVAIGRPFEGMKAAVASPDLKWVEDDTRGELLLSGPQLALGYLDDPEKTRSSFVEIDGERWYRTGDLALRDLSGVFHYLGRIDNQVKVLGYRVELQEIEFHLREITGCESVAAIAWPQSAGTATGLVAFVSGFDGNVATVKDEIARRLPFYMLPSHIQPCSELPLNNNGKVDRNALSRLLDDRENERTA